MPTRNTNTPSSRRRGVALITALLLLILGSALLAGTAAASRSAARSAQARAAIAIAVGEARAGLARYVNAWGPSQDSLATGSDLLTTDTRLGSAGALSAVASIRLRRLSSSRYVLAIETRVGLPASPLAIRRMRVILERAPPPDSTSPRGAPSPMPRWAVSDLY